MFFGFVKKRKINIKEGLPKTQRSGHTINKITLLFTETTISWTNMELLLFYYLFSAVLDWREINPEIEHHGSTRGSFILPVFAFGFRLR